MRGMSPPGRRTWGSRRDVASSPRRPPPLSVTTGTPYASAVSAADSTSAVSPEYDTATTRASLPAVRGRPYPRCTRMGTSSRGRPEAARRSAPLAEPPIPAMMISDGRRRGRGGSLQSACAARHWAGKGSGSPPHGGDRPAARRAGRRGSQPLQRDRGDELARLASAEPDRPDDEDRRPLVDPLEAGLGHRHGLDRAPCELGGGRPREARAYANPFVDEGHARRVPLAACAAERWPAGRGQVPARGVPRCERQVPLDGPAPRHRYGSRRDEPVSHLDGCLTDRDRLLDAHEGLGAAGERDDDGAAHRPRRAAKRLAWEREERALPGRHGVERRRAGVEPAVQE